MKAIKIQKSKSIQKPSIKKNIKEKKYKKQNNNHLDNTFKNKIKNKSLNKKNNTYTNKSNEESNNNSLITAIESNNIVKIEELLKNNKTNINKLNDIGFSPLHISVIKGNIKIINLLIKNGAKINILTSKRKQTPLHLAYMNYNNNSKNIIKLLINSGANEKILDSNNKKPSDYLKSYINTNSKINKNSQIKNFINNKIKSTNNINNINNIKEKNKKNGYKGNIYNLKDSKDNSFVVITMDNISYLTSDQNTIIQISDDNTKNNSINTNENEIKNTDENNNTHNNNNNIHNNNKDNINKNNNRDKDNILKDSLDEESIIKTRKRKHIEDNYIEKNEFEDSLEISDDKKSNQNHIYNKGKTPNIINKKFNNFSNYYSNNNYIQNNPSKNLDDLFKSLIKNKRYSYFKLIKNNSSMKNDNNLNRNTFSSHYENTDNSTNKIIKNNNSIDNTNEKINKKNYLNNNDLYFNNTYKTNRNSYNSITSTISQTNKKKNYKKAQSFTKENEIKNNFSQINKNCSYLLNWLMNIQLSSYYKNFLDNEIYDINKLVEQMKTINKFSYEDIESLLLIHKPGHVFRILTQLEIDAGIIDKSVANFMINNNNKDIFESSNMGKTLLFSNNEKYSCKYCCNIDIDICGEKYKKNDLKSFLMRYDIINLYQNFCHNGFDLINYVILQMYGSNPIDSDILENNFHIYDEDQRYLVLKAIEKEINKINKFLNSEIYYENENSSLIKYDNVIFEKNSNNENISEIKIDNKKNECIIF